MIWLTWRQLRTQTLVTAAMLALLAALLVATGLDLAGQYSSSGLSACNGQAACQSAASSFLSLVSGSPLDQVFYVGIVLTYVVPALIGMFWGAPLIARELETGTFRLAWNQSVSRTRWVLVKLGLIGLIAMATAGLLGWMTSWWASPIYRAAALTGKVQSRITPLAFGAQGITPLGYAAFAFALGVTVGLLIRRTIPAMALTLAMFAFVQLAWPNWVRPHLISPVRYTAPLSIGNLDEVMITNGTSMTVQDSAIRPELGSSRTFPSSPTARCSQARQPEHVRARASRRATPRSHGCTCTRSSPTSPRAGSGSCRGSRSAASWPSRSRWPDSAPGGSGADS